MDKGIVNEVYLSENIKQMEFYANEEKESLGKICQGLEDCSNYYNSNNTVQILNNINEFKINIEKLYKKRMNYNKIFEQVIIQYNTLSEITKQKFDKFI